MSGSSPAPALSADQLRALVEASRRAKSARRCAGVATLGGWTTGIFGGLTLLSMLLSPSLPGAFIGIALLIAAHGEFKGGTMVRRFDPRGAMRLAWNQAFLGAALVAYAIWCMVLGLTGHGELASIASGSPEVDAMLAGIERTATVALYGTLAVVGVVAPGLTAWYYASRAKHIQAMRDQTDATVIEALKAA